jgi:hypothetical protein
MHTRFLSELLPVEWFLPIGHAGIPCTRAHVEV